MGFLVKLDTNGSFPNKLSELIDAGLLDYVAMDIKNSPNKYAETSGAEVDIESIKKSVSVLMEGKIDFEFRTTVVREFHSIFDMDSAKNNTVSFSDGSGILQMFVPSEHTIAQGLLPYSKEELEALREIVLPYVPNTSLRGV